VWTDWQPQAGGQSGGAAAAAAGQFFQPGDLVLHTERDLRVFRQEREVARWPSAGPVCAGADRNVWTARAEDSRVALRQSEPRW
jgi:hypothetical protein